MCRAWLDFSTQSNSAGSAISCTAHRHAQDAARDRVALGRAGRRHQRLAQDLAGHRVGGAGGDAEQRHRPQELAAIALALGELLPGQVHQRMLPPLMPILLAHAIAPSSRSLRARPVIGDS